MSPTALSNPHHAPNAALLIDFDNVTMGIRSELQTELKNLLSSDIVKGKVSVQRAYADWRRYPQYIVPLAESSIDMIMATAYGSAKKNATDIRLAVDAMELVFTRPEIGIFILLSGDSDFASLVTKLKEYGKYVIGVGIRESSSDLLVMNCDEYYSYNALAGLVKSGEEEIVKKDPWELVTESITRMKRNGDVMRADRLKQVMQQIDSSFDEKNLGMSKFSRFVTEAAHRGLLTLTKLENGQLEVGPPGSAARTLPAGQESAEPHVPRLAAPAEGEPAERPRRGRRGGRGRDRDVRGHRPATTAAPQISPSEPEFPPLPQAEAADVAVPASAADGIGSRGLRLRREEAFDLVRRSVGVNGDAPVRASQVRATARELLGRDSESLSERNFTRILQDAHDADIIDLRRRGSDYEVAPAAPSTSVSEQLAAAEPPKPIAPVTPSAPTGMGARAGGPARGRGRGPIGARVGIVPPDLLSVGVVETSRPAPEPVFTESIPDLPLTGEDALSDSDLKPRSVRKRVTGDDKKPRRPRKSAAVSDEDAEKPSPRRAPRKSRSRTASE
ncbi:MAG TPA: NYN domain-containing protein [Gemmatimonadaceae bacterium]|nr:NYN domain-containing protein [Gemmatimonadaceae bacterium]